MALQLWASRGEGGSAGGMHADSEGDGQSVRRRCGGASGSGFEAEGELFDDRVGEDLAGDALDLGLGMGGITGEGVVEGELEVLALADVGDAVVLHAAERAGDGLALSVEHGPLQRDVNMRLHSVIIDLEERAAATSARVGSRMDGALKDWSKRAGVNARLRAAKWARSRTKRDLWRL